MTRRGLMTARIGMLCWSGEPWKTVRLAAEAGFNCVVIDCEHGGATAGVVEAAAALARAVDVLLLVRVRSSEDIGTVLDCGAHGVLLPHVESADQAALAAGLAKYPGMGRRSLSSTRLRQLYRGVSLSEAILAANRETLVFVTVESASAVAAVDQIAAVPQVDGIVVGALDLSTDFGSPGEFGAPNVLDAHRAVAKACREKGKRFGAFWQAPILSREIASLAPDLVIAGSDDSHFVRAASKCAVDIRAQLG